MFDEGASSEALSSWGHLAQDWLINNMAECRGGRGGGASAFGEGQVGQATEPGWGPGQGGGPAPAGCSPALGCLSLPLPRSLAWLAHVQPAAQRARLCPGQIFRGHRVTQIVLNLFLLSSKMTRTTF